MAAPSQQPTTDDPYEIVSTVPPRKKIEHIFKRSTVHLMKLGFRRGREYPTPLDVSKWERVIFLRPEKKIGDLVISLPAVDLLRRSFPHLKVSLFCSKENRGLVKDDPRFEHIFCYHRRLGADITEVKKARQVGFDCIIDLLCDDSVTALALSQWIAPGAPRLAASKGRYRKYYDCQDATDFTPSRHIILNTMNLLRPLGVETRVEDGYAPPFITDERQAAADEFVMGIIERDRPALLVGLNLSAGTTSRDWGVENSIKLARMILDKYRHASLIIFTPPSERDRGRALTCQLPERTHLIPDKLGILDATAIIRRLHVLVTPDTAVVHLARSFKIPVLSLIPGHIRNLSMWGPYDQEVGTVMAGTQENIYDITPDQVMPAMAELIEAYRLPLK